MKQSIFYYGAVVLVALFSVQTGLEFVAAPMSPMPEIKVVAFTLPPPPAPPAPPVAAKPATPVIVTPPRPVPAPPVAAKPLQPPAAAVVTPASPPADIPSAPVAETPKALCDVHACAAAYRSFRESDCTFNPSFGPRRLCTKGVVPKETAAPAPTSPSVPEPPKDAGAASNLPASSADPEPGPAAAPAANPSCNVSACAAAYPRSFRESDCTFNPSSGPRKVCTR
jgi:hypothetical protein